MDGQKVLLQNKLLLDYAIEMRAAQYCENMQTC